MVQLLGIDISHFQGPLNFDQLKSDTGFVIIKATEGTSITDPLFVRNQTEARRVGISVGYYHFAHPELNTPQQEAAYFLKQVGDLQSGEVLSLDYENMAFSSPVPWCVSFLQEIVTKTGCKPLLYLNKSLVSAHDWTPVIQTGFGLWLADYSNSPDSVVPIVPWPIVALRQYSDQLIVQGTKADGDVFYGDAQAFQKYGYQGSPAPSSDQKIYTEADMTSMRLQRDQNWQLYQDEVVKYTEAIAEVGVVNTQLTDEKNVHQKDLESIAQELQVPVDMAKILPAIQTCITFEDQANQLTVKLQAEQAQYAKDLKSVNDQLLTLETQLADTQKALDAAKKQVLDLQQNKPSSVPGIKSPLLLPLLIQKLIHLFQRNA